MNKTKLNTKNVLINVTVFTKNALSLVTASACSKTS